MYVSTLDLMGMTYHSLNGCDLAITHLMGVLEEVDAPFLSLSLTCSSKAGKRSLGTGFKSKWERVSNPRS